MDRFKQRCIKKRFSLFHLSLKNLGMILVDIKSNPKATIEFTAEINLLEGKTTKAIIWEGYEPVITSQTTHQVCTINFEEIKAEEIKEEDLLKLKQFTDSLSSEKGLKARALPKEDFDLPLLSLGRQKSKSQDYKETKKSSREKCLEELPERKLSSFSRRKLANVILTTNSLSLEPENIKSDKFCDNKSKKASKFKTDTSSSNLGQLLKEINHSNMSLQEKLKHFKKNVYMYAEDFAPKKKTQIKFIIIEPNQTKVLRFKFKYHPEYLIKGQKIIINDSSMKAIGTIREIFHVKSEA